MCLVCVSGEGVQFDAVESPSLRELWSHTYLSHIAPPLRFSGLFPAFAHIFLWSSVSIPIRSGNESTRGRGVFVRHWK